MPELWEAKGHVAKIVRFDEATCLLPLNEREAFRLLASLRVAMKKLKETNDFPEEKEWQNLIDNLQTVIFMLIE